MEEKRMTVGTCLKTYFRQCLEVFKHPKLLLPTIILSVIWIGLGILQNHVERNFPLSVINFLTFAQGGLYGGILGAIGGILGKIVVAAFVNIMIVPLFYKKNPFANIKQGFKDIVANIKFESKDAASLLLKGFGIALLLYSIFNVTQSLENSMVGIMSIVALIMAAARKNGFLWNLVLSIMNTASKGKVPSYQRIIRLLTGLTLGFSIGVVLSAVGPMWAAGSLGLLALVGGLIMGSRLKKTAAMFGVGILLIVAPLSAQARDKGWVLTKTDTQVTSTTAHNEEVTKYHSWIVDVSNIKATQYGFSFDAVEVHTEKSNGEKRTRTTHYESSFDPFEKSYQPGDKFNGNHRWKGHLGFVKVKVKGYVDTNNGEEDEQFLGPASEEKGFAYAHFTFPPKDKVNGDKLVVRYVAQIYDESVTLTYVFQWNGKADASDTTNENITVLEWLSKLLDTNETHTPDEITIIIGILGVLGGLGGALGGGLGGGLGGTGGGGFPGGEGPIGGNEPSPEELEWQRYQKEMKERFNKYVHDNPDGTKTYIDPATGEKHTLYPKYNTETGEFTHWENENDTPYDEDKLNDWLAWRERNNETFSQDAAQAQRNLAEQRAMNQAQNEYDRNRGSSATADAYRVFKEQSEKDLEHVMRLRDLVWKHGVANEEELSKFLRQDMHNALQENAEAMNNATYWNDWVTSTEVLETTCDKFINVAGETSPLARQVKNYYTIAKSVLKHGSMGVVKGQGFGGLAAELGVGVAEGGLGVLQNEEMTGVFGESFTGGLVKSGVNVGAEMGKTLLNDLLDPNKSAKDIMDDLTTAGINRIGYETIGKITSGLGGYASDTSQYGVNTVTAFNQEAGTHEAITNVIAEEINRYRQRLIDKENNPQ